MSEGKFMSDEPSPVWRAETVFSARLDEAASQWVLKIERPSGHITLNPEIPQEEAVHEFVRLCNEMVEQHDAKDRKDAEPGTLILLNEEIERLHREAKVYRESAESWREQYLELEAKVIDVVANLQRLIPP